MKYTKKPITIEAFQYTGKIRAGWPQWALRRTKYETELDYIVDLDDTGLVLTWPDNNLIIFTLEGKMKVSKGDWIVKGVNGELYPIKPDIFEATYSPTQPTVKEK